MGKLIDNYSEQITNAIIKKSEKQIAATLAADVELDHLSIMHESDIKLNEQPKLSSIAAELVVFLGSEFVKRRTIMIKMKNERTMFFSFTITKESLQERGDYSVEDVTTAMKDIEKSKVQIKVSNNCPKNKYFKNGVYPYLEIVEETDTQYSVSMNPYVIGCMSAIITYYIQKHIVPQTDKTSNLWNSMRHAIVDSIHCEDIDENQEIYMKRDDLRILLDSDEFKNYVIDQEDAVFRKLQDSLLGDAVNFHDFYRYILYGSNGVLTKNYDQIIDFYFGNSVKGTGILETVLENQIKDIEKTLESRHSSEETFLTSIDDFFYNAVCIYVKTLAYKSGNYPESAKKAFDVSKVTAFELKHIVDVTKDIIQLGYLNLLSSNIANYVFCNSQELVDDMFEQHKSKYIYELEEENSHLKKQLKEEANKQIPNSSVSNNNELESLRTQLAEQQRANQKLQKKFDSLTSKYQRLKNKAETESEESIPPDDEDVVLDKQARYLFVTGREDIKDNLQKEFPNAVFCTGVTKIPSNFDAAVILTDTISHVIYHFVKSHITDPNIKIIHTSCKNVDAIISDMKKCMT